MRGCGLGSFKEQAIALERRRLTARGLAGWATKAGMLSDDDPDGEGGGG